MHGKIWHGERKGEPVWFIEAAPYVATRLKKILPKVNRYQRGTIAVVDTAETAFELEWILSRWPMHVDPADSELLASKAAQYRESRDTVSRILQGYIPPSEWREPLLIPRDYQLVAAALAHETGSLLLADSLGLGKSFTSLLLLRDPDALPALVVAQTHLVYQWEREVRKAFPWLTPHVIETGKVYDPLGSVRQLPFGESTGNAVDVLIVNYHKLAKWSEYLAGTVRTVIFDEAQELRRRGTGKYEAATRVAREARFRVGATATPVYNMGDEIHSVVSVLDPQVLGSEEEFKREWCTYGYGKPKVADPAALGAYLRDQGIMLRRTREEVGRELPDVIRVTHTIDLDSAKLDALTSDATVLAKTILEATGSPTELFRASGEFDWRLRHATGVAKAPYVAEFTRLLLESGEAVVLFAWHRSFYEILLERLDDFKPAMYTGSETGKHKERNAQAFLDGETDLLIMSLRAGAGLDGLQERSKVAVFGELDWSPGVHAQGIGRLHRDGQTEPVLAYFLVADSGSDPAVAEVLNLKRQQSEPIIDPNLEQVVAVDQTDRVKLLARQFLNQKGPQCS